jgi:hypothetical protein
MAAPNVVFCRPLLLGSKGGDVRAHKRAISHALPAAYPWREFTPYFGEWLEKAVKEFQREHGIQATGKIGRATHEALERTHAKNKPDKWAFDATAITLAKNFCHDYTTTPEERVRRAIVSAGFFWYAHRASIAYSQARPFQLGKPPWVPSRWDCSGFVTACHYAGGAPDPNGRGYDHLGYTGTLMSQGHMVGNINDLDPGDLCFYGSTTHGSGAFPVGSPTHVALYAGIIGGVPCVLSDGSYPMRLLPYSYRPINHLRHYEVV